jgi:hypothetical protein
LWTIAVPLTFDPVAAVADLADDETGQEQGD